MKRKIELFVCLFLGLLLLHSCDIDQVPETELSDENFWNSKEDFKMAVNYLYTTLPGLSNSDLQEFTWGTFAYPNESPNSISDGSRVAPNSSGDYDYESIYQSNNIIEKAHEFLEESDNTDEKLINSYIGEARFFRAWAYFEMFKRYGGVPIIKKTLSIDDDEVFKARASREEVLSFIYDDLDAAIDNLRTTDQVEYGRISTTAAMAFKSRVALFAGTWSKFHQEGNADKSLQLARDAAKNVIDSGVYSLYSNPHTTDDGKMENNAYFNLFQEKGEGNDENIIVKIYGENNDNNIVSKPTQRYLEGDVVPTNNFVRHYVMIDGLPIDKSPLFEEPDNEMKYLDFFKGRDPRMNFTLMKKGDEFQPSSDFVVPSPTNQRTGYMIRKYADAQAWLTQKSFIDRPVLRYAEVLLNYIEAKYELEGQVSDDDLDLTINAIRDRLPEVNIGTANHPDYKSLPRLTNSFIDTYNLSMRKAIRRERSVELAFEINDYWDKIRWKTAEEELSKSIKGSYLFTEFFDYGWSEDTNVDDKGYIIIQNASLRKFDPNKDYLWPIPKNELSKNDKLEQNPGWN